MHNWKTGAFFLFSIAPGNMKCHANVSTLAGHEFQFDFPMGVHDIIVIFMLLSEAGSKIKIECLCAIALA